VFGVRLPILNKVKLPFQIKPRRKVVALESSGEYLKLAVVESTPRGKKLSRLLARTVVLQDDLSVLLRSVVEEGLIPADSRVLISIPRNLVTVRNLQLPTTDPKELREMVNLQAVKQTPFLKDEIIADYQIVRSGIEGYTDVILVTTHRSVPNSSLKTLDDAGLQAEGIRLSTQGVLSAFLAMGGIAGEDRAATLAMVDVDSNFCDFMVVAGGQISFTKAISVGPVKLLMGGEIEIQKFTEEIQRAIEIYGNEGIGGKISKIVLSGAEIDLENLMSRLGDALQIPVEQWLLSKTSRGVPEIMDAPENCKGALSYSSVVGLAWNPRGAKIDLTPPEVRLRESLARKGKSLTAIGISVILLLTAVTVLVSQKLYARKEYLSELREEVAQTDKYAGEVEAMRKKIRLIGDATGFQNSSLEILSVLHRTLPPDVYLKSVTFEDGSYLVLQGVSEKMSAVFGLLSTLEKQPQFHHVKTKHITRSARKGGQEEINFEMTCLLTNDGET